MSGKKSSIEVVEVIAREGRAREDVLEGLTVSKVKTAFVGIKDAPALLGIKYTIYARRLLLEGKLEGIKLRYKGYDKWYISKESIAYYTENKSRRTEGRRYILRIDLEDENKVREVLTAAGISFDLELSYKGKDEN